MATLLERIGGEAAVKAVVDSFYDKVFADKVLAPFFANTDFVKQRERQTKFMVRFMDGKAPAANEYMRNAHRKYVAEMGLNGTHFDIVVNHLVATLKEFNVPGELIAETGGALESLRADVLDLPVQSAA